MAFTRRSAIQQPAGRRAYVSLAALALLLPLGYIWLTLQTSVRIQHRHQRRRRRHSSATSSVDAATATVQTATAAAQPSLLQRAYALGGSAVAQVTARVTQHPECEGTLGTWCNEFKSQTPIPYKEPPLGQHKCLWGCNFVGVCDAHAGWCSCPAGWQGDACDVRMKRPCSQHYHRSGFEPYDGPIDYSVGSLTLACAGECDKDIGMCYCNSSLPFGRVPANPAAPPGTPPVQFGRPMGMQCQPNADPHGVKGGYGSVDYDKLFGKDGWCVAEDPPQENACPCYLDGLHGKLCDGRHEAFCINQCSGHGECNVGFCHCHEGWFGLDCAQRAEGTPWTPGLVESRPWLKTVALTPAAEPAEPGKTRLRPLIYVYDLPPRFNAHLLQYRTTGSHGCVHRLFHPHNQTFHTNWVYSSETGLHEYLAQSPHRTLDPEEADFFYLPMYPGCFQWPILGAADFPFWHGGSAANRAQSLTNMYIDAWSWVRSHYPYWDRHGGKDHIVLAAVDEGSCFVPNVLRPAILLAHWGRTDPEHEAYTGYGPDIYSTELTHPVFQPEGHLNKINLKRPCIDRSKDLTIPLVWSPEKYGDAPLFGKPTRPREFLATFKGRVQPNNLRYSRGVRQHLAKKCEEGEWWSKYKIHIGEGLPQGVDASYSGMLSSSVFCFVLMGDGWSARFDDAIINGCIPVVVMDGIDVGYETIIDMKKISIRIDQKDMDRIPEILTAVSNSTIEEMQRSIAKVWRRFMYSGLRSHAKVVRDFLDKNRKEAEAAPLLSLPAPETDYDPEEDDAFATLIQWLYSRIPHTR